MIDSSGGQKKKGPSFLLSILVRDSNFASLADQLGGCSPCLVNLQILIRDPATVDLGHASGGPNCHPAVLDIPSPADSAVRGGSSGGEFDEFAPVEVGQAGVGARQ